MIPINLPFNLIQLITNDKSKGQFVKIFRHKPRMFMDHCSFASLKVIISLHTSRRKKWCTHYIVLYLKYLTHSITGSASEFK